jgi:hypothetical protein
VHPCESTALKIKYNNKQAIAAHCMNYVIPDTYIQIFVGSILGILAYTNKHLHWKIIHLAAKLLFIIPVYLSGGASLSQHTSVDLYHSGFTS